MVAVAIGGAAVIGGATQYASGKSAAKAQGKAANQQVAESQRQYDQTREDYAPWRRAGTSALGKLESVYGLGDGTDWEAFVKADPWREADWRANYPDMSMADYGKYNYQYDVQRGRKDNPNYAGMDLSQFKTQPGAQFSDFYASPGYQFRLSEGQKAIERSAAARGGLNSGATMKALERFAQGTASDEFNRYVGGLQSMAGLGQNAQNATTAAGQQSSQNIINAYGNAGNARASSYANTGSAINSGINNVLSAYLMGSGSGGPYGAGSTMNAYGINGGNIY